MSTASPEAGPPCRYSASGERQSSLNRPIQASPIRANSGPGHSIPRVEVNLDREIAVIKARSMRHLLQRTMAAQPFLQFLGPVVALDRQDDPHAARLRAQLLEDRQWFRLQVDDL